MRMVGMLLWIGGALIYLGATFVFDPSVPTYGGYGTNRMVNMDLQQRQLLLALGGLTLVLGGIVVHALSALTEDRLSVTRPADASESPASRSRASSDDEPVLSDEELMSRHDIARQGDHFVYGEYRYTSLRDAVNYARLQQNKDIETSAAAARLGIRAGDDGAAV